MGGVVRFWRLQSASQQAQLAILLGVIGVLGAYALLAIFPQPVAADGAEAFTGVRGQKPFADPQAQSLSLDSHGPPVLVWGYVDHGVNTLVKSVVNTGPIPLTITGVENNDLPGWAALITIKDDRAAVTVGRFPCCEIDPAATWSAHDFRPISVAPGHHAVVAVHMVMGNCEYNNGGFEIIDSIKVHYTVLGFPHVQAVGVGPYWFRTPDTCPRTGPARPA
jgi:hypothetical protein